MAPIASARIVDNIARLRGLWLGRRSGELTLWLRGHRSRRVSVVDGGLVGQEAIVLVSQAVARGHLRFRPAASRSSTSTEAGDRRALARVLLSAARSCADVLARPLPEGRLRLGVPPAEAATLLGDGPTERLLGRRLPIDLVLREGHLTRGQLLAALEVGLLEVVAEADIGADRSQFAAADPELGARLRKADLPRSVPPPPEVPRARRQRPPRLRLGAASTWEEEDGRSPPAVAAIAFVAGITPGPSVLAAAEEASAGSPADPPAPGAAGPTDPVRVAPWGMGDEDDTEELFPIDPDEEIDDPETREPTLAPRAVAGASVVPDLVDEASLAATPAVCVEGPAAAPAPPASAPVTGLPRVPWPETLEPVRGVGDHILRVQAILVGRARDAVMDGDLDEARHALLRADTLAPDNPRVLVHLAWVELLMDPAGREAAMERVYRAAATSPEDPVVGGFAAEISWLIREGRLG